MLIYGHVYHQEPLLIKFQSQKYILTGFRVEDCGGGGGCMVSEDLTKFNRQLTYVLFIA